MIVEAVCNQCGIVYLENENKAHFARYCRPCQQKKQEWDAIGCFFLIFLLGAGLMIWQLFSLVANLKG